jgi:hypothetical protein
MATEGYYEYMRDVPCIFGSLPTVPNANGAYCAPGQQTCFAPEWTTVYYLQKQFSKKDYISIRNELLVVTLLVRPLGGNVARVPAGKDFPR